MIRVCDERDFEQIYEVINNGARAYRGVIPDDRWPGDPCIDPYMPREKLQHEIAAGVRFYALEENSTIDGVMGLQDVDDVTLVRHAYVRMSAQRRGIGARLLAHLREIARKPVLIGTWADATWAIGFYEKHGFRMVSKSEKERLLRRYWQIPERQVETSVVLADANWWAKHPGASGN
jgi:N-acetylglutamate synthase-like GNAT family acetyltransferase